MEIRTASQQFAIWPAAAAILLVLVIIMWRRKHSLSYVVCFAVFGVYVLVALDKLFFPMIVPITQPDAEARARFLTNGINLIPFHISDSARILLPYIFMREFVGNIVLTIPFGFGLSFVARVRAKSFLWLAPALPLGIETTQLASCLILGNGFRSFDVNDIMLNALGMLIGYGLFRVFAWLYLWVMQRMKIRPGGLAAYAHEIASRA